MKIKFLALLSGLLIASTMKAYKLTAYIPQENPTETGVIVCPGGSYFWLDKVTEGEKVARWLSENGIAAFVLGGGVPLRFMFVRRGAVSQRVSMTCRGHWRV